MSISVDVFVDLINNYAPNPSVIIEVGAYRGSETQQLKSAFPSARLIAIDGDPRSYEALLNLQGVEAYNRVISSRDEAVSFFLKDIHSISGLYDRGVKYPGTCERFLAEPLKGFCKDNEISQIDVLKVDAEGSALDILVGLGEMVSCVRIMHLETEDYPYFSGATGHHTVVRHLINVGFIPIAVAGVVIGAGRQYDSVWVREDILDARFRRQ